MEMVYHRDYYYWQQDTWIIINNISTDLRLSKSQTPKVIQSGGFLASFFSKLAGPLTKLAISLAKNVLARLAIKAAASAIYAGI